MAQTQTLGEFIREKRKKAGLTQEELCVKVGIKQGFLTQIEQNKRVGSPDTLLSISRALGLKPAYKIFAVFDKEARMSEDDANPRFVRLPDRLTSEDRDLVEKLVDHLSKLRDLQHDAQVESKYDQIMAAEAAQNLNREPSQTESQAG